MKAGKLAPDELERLVLGRFLRRRQDVLVPAGLGEDSAVIDFGEEVCVVSTDPITGVGEGAGWLAVHVSCNDIAANGARPVGVQVALMLPEGTDDQFIVGLMDDIERGCAELGIEVLGGHTEITSRVTSPLVVTTAVGRAPRHGYVTSAGATAGDAVVVTKGVGIEGTAILAAEWESMIRRSALAKSVEEKTLERLLATARSYADEISAVREGVAAASFGVSAMHDVTEGGLYGALYEMGRAASVGFRIERDKVPVRKETAFICNCLNLDPLGLISSGTMLIACPDGPALVDHLHDLGVAAFVIGEVHNEASVLIYQDGRIEPLPLLPEDELWCFLSSQTQETEEDRD